MRRGASSIAAGAFPEEMMQSSQGSGEFDLIGL